MAMYRDFSGFKRRVYVDALIANGRAALNNRHGQAFGYFVRAALHDRLSVRSLFWLAIGIAGPHLGGVLYRRLLSVRRVETVDITSSSTFRASKRAEGM